MKTLTVKLPEQVTDVDEKEVRMIVAARLFEQEKLSSGRAAEVAGITKREFNRDVRSMYEIFYEQVTFRPEFST